MRQVKAITNFLWKGEDGSSTFVVKGEVIEVDKDAWKDVKKYCIELEKLK